MKRSVIDANSIRKSLAKATALVAAAVASASCVVNAADLTVEAGSPKILSAAESANYYEKVIVDDDLTIDGENGASLTNSTSIAIGASATHPVTIVVTNGAKWVGNKNKTITFSGKGGTIIASSPTTPSYAKGSSESFPDGETFWTGALGTVGNYDDIVLASTAEADSGVMDIVRLLPNSTVSFRNVKNTNLDVAARILFEGGVHWLLSSSTTRFSVANNAKIILQSVDSNPITIRNLWQNYTLFAGAETLETKGDGDFVLFIGNNSYTATLSHDEGARYFGTIRVGRF